MVRQRAGRLREANRTGEGRCKHREEARARDRSIMLSLVTKARHYIHQADKFEE